MTDVELTYLWLLLLLGGGLLGLLAVHAVSDLWAGRRRWPR